MGVIGYGSSARLRLGSSILDPRSRHPCARVYGVFRPAPSAAALHALVYPSGSPRCGYLAAVLANAINALTPLMKPPPPVAP